MKMAVDISDRELADAMRFTRPRTKREAILTSIMEFNRRRRMTALIRHPGPCSKLPTVPALRRQRRNGKPLVLVDTSSWIHQLRPRADVATRERVERILGDGEAGWCPMIRLDLWNGGGGDRKQAVL